MSLPSLGPSSSKAEEMHMETVAPVSAAEEEIHCSEVAVIGATAEEHTSLGLIPLGTFSFAPSPSLNVFANIFQASGMD